MVSSLEKRFWEIDFLRGLAVLMMIIFHLLYDLNYFGNYDLNLRSGFWMYFGRFTALIFIFLVGVSLTLSFSRSIAKNRSQSEIILKNIKRGVKIFSWGMVITVITFILLPEGVIYFGILHFIGLSIILSYPFLRLGYANIFAGFAFVLAAIHINPINVDNLWLLWLGMAPQGLYSFDYFPLLPWFGVILFGIFTGNMFYHGYSRIAYLPDLTGNGAVRLFCMIGQHSLLIYLIHQPVLIILIYITGIADLSILQ